MKAEYRVVKFYHQFFNNWAVRLERKISWRFLWWKGESWCEVAKHPFSSLEPASWADFNIVDRIVDDELYVQ